MGPALRLRDSALPPPGLWADTAPAAPVAVARCATYGPEVTTTLAGMFDYLGGLSKLVNGKTVSMKVNLTGAAGGRLGSLPQGETHWVHPDVVGAIPAGQSGCAAHSPAGESPGSRFAGGVYFPRRLDSSGPHQRRCQRGVGEHELSRGREQIYAPVGARWRDDV